MTTVKTEGFTVPGAISIPHRPPRAFSDGSMAIETDILASLDPHQPPLFPHSLPAAQYSPHFSPQSNSLDLDPTSPHPFHPSLFAGFKFNHNPEPPVAIRPSSRSLVPKKPNRTRKLSMDTRPTPNRGPVPHPRTMSHGDSFAARAMGLETHNERSISPPEYNAYGIPIASSWNSTDGAPSLIPGSFGSYSMPEEAVMDSPMTPAQTLPTLDDTYRKQRRRECHNQVEKRRREHINSKIEELSQLLPPHYNEPEEAVEDEEDEEPAVSPLKKKKTKRSGSSAKQQKDAAHCKGRILSKSVQYIRDLRNMTAMQAARIQHLESLLAIPAQAYPYNVDFSHQPELATLAEHVDVLQPPASWQITPHTDGLMTFEPSPTEQSSASANQFRRSSSSTSESAEGDGKLGSGGLLASPERAESPRYQDGHRASDVELAMSGMDIDAMFNARRDDTTGMRW